MSNEVYIQFAIWFILVALCLSLLDDRNPRPTLVRYKERVKFESLPDVLMLDSDNSPDQNKNYRTLIFSDDLSQLYVGGQEKLHIVHPSNMTISGSFVVTTTPASKTTCGFSGEPLNCYNYVRIIQPFGDNYLFVCGTDASIPKCYFADKMALTLTDADPAFTDEYGVPSLPNQNSSWLYLVEDFKLFTGVGALNKKSRVDYNIRLANLTSFGMSYDEEDVDADSSQEWLSEPDFVGEPIEYEGHVYFFFREFASEHVNGGRIVYPRVGRVCKNDTGGAPFTDLANEFTTYQKARMDCSVRVNGLDFDYNEMQDIYQSGMTIFAVFTTPSVGTASSAVCAYSLDEIVELFNVGQVKGQGEDGFLWTPPSTDPPVNVFKCSALPFADSYQSFLLRYPLMNVEAHNKLDYKDTSTNSYLRKSDAPLILVDNVRLLQIVVDEDVNGFDVMFIGTTRGTVIKAYLSEDKSTAILIEEIDFNMDVSKSEAPILTMLKQDSQDYIYVGTDNNVYRLPLQSCSNKTKCQCYCDQDPYCALDGTECIWKTGGVTPTAGDTMDCNCEGTDTPDIPVPPSGNITVVRHQPCQNCNQSMCPEKSCQTYIPNNEIANLNFAAHAPEGTNLTASEVVCNCLGNPVETKSKSVCGGKEFVTVNAVLNVTSSCSCSITFTSVNDMKGPLVTEIQIDNSSKVNDQECIREASEYDKNITIYKHDLKNWTNCQIEKSNCAARDNYCRSGCP